MKGLELAERFYFEIVYPIIGKYFPILVNKYAAGLIGYGSDVLGHDDELSMDHEWGPRCYIWLSDEDYKLYSSDIDRILYKHLPQTFMGFPTRYSLDISKGGYVPDLNGDIHHIAITTVSRYMRIQYEIYNNSLDTIGWLSIPEQKLLELTRGKVFCDPIGYITSVREKFHYLPQDIWLYKLKYAWLSLDKLHILTSCILRNDVLSTRLMISKLVERIVKLIYLLNKKYTPGTMKWFSKEFYQLPILSKEIGYKLEALLETKDYNDTVGKFEEIYIRILEEQNNLDITQGITFESIIDTRKLRTISLANAIDAINYLLPKELKEKEISGAIDQWISNDEILIMSENYIKFKSIYELGTHKQRDRVGDNII